MSDAYAQSLAHRGTSTYERFALGVVAGSFVAFAAAAGTLFGWVPVSGPVVGVPVPMLFGAGVLGLGFATAALGLLSRRGGAPTAPHDSAGLVPGLGQTLLWGTIAGLVGSHTLELGAVGWLVAVPVGLAAGYGTIAAREDVGMTGSVAAFACLVGVVVLAGVVTPTRAWEPAAFDAAFPGTVVIPLLTMGVGLLTGWAGAAAAEGFGAPGRQHGAFVLISLVVVLVFGVLAFLLAFVFERGLGVVLENLTLSAGTVLLLSLAILVLLVRFGRPRPTATSGSRTVVAYVHLAAAVLVGLGVIGLGIVLATDRTLTGDAVTVEPTAVVGAVPGLVAGAVLLLALRQASRPWAPSDPLGRRVAGGFRIASLLIGGLALVEVATLSELAVAGVAVVPTVALAVGAVAAGAAILSGGTRWWLPGGAPNWWPPSTRAATLALWAFVVVCLHVVITGVPLAAGPVGLVAGGTIDWPFIMNPSQGLGIQQGVMPAMLGTVWIVLGAVVFAVPFAVGAAVYLTEYASTSLFTSAVDVATNGLWSTPSIVFGLFGLAFLVPRFGGTPSIFAAQLVLGFMLLPLVLITSREAMKSVPDEYRDASAALGVSKWQTIRSVVIPAAMPGVTTGVILGVGRIAGETAPLLLVLNGPNFPNAAPGVLSSFTFEVGLQPPFVHVSNPALLERASALPYQLYAIITAGVGAEESFGWGTALVLLGVVLSFFAMGIATRRYFRRRLHQ